MDREARKAELMAQREAEVEEILNAEEAAEAAAEAEAAKVAELEALKAEIAATEAQLLELKSRLPEEPVVEEELAPATPEDVPAEVTL